MLCRPQDYTLVSPAGKSADAGGTTREARFDPLDAAQRAERDAAGLQIFATVLQPGETIIAPDSWWHYAISLTPTITFMANFWDHKNLEGVRRLIYEGCSPAAPERSLGAAPRAFRVAGAGPLAVVREKPTADAPLVGCLRRGETARFDMEKGGWMRVAGSGSAAAGPDAPSDGGGGGGALLGGWVRRGQEGRDEVWLEDARAS